MHWKHAITWDMLEELVEDPLVEIGSHTINHRRISSLSVEDATLEMAGSRNRLEERLGIPVQHFAFPYGRSGDCGPRDFAIGIEAGYETIATTRKGLMRNDTPLDHLPRVTLNGNQQKIALIEAHLSAFRRFWRRSPAVSERAPLRVLSIAHRRCSATSGDAAISSPRRPRRSRRASPRTEALVPVRPLDGRRSRDDPGVTMHIEPILFRMPLA